VIITNKRYKMRDHHDNDISEVSVSSVGTDNSAFSALAKMMQDQAALVNVMASKTARNADPYELNQLELEKRELAEQVMALQRELNTAAQGGIGGNSYDDGMDEGYEESYQRRPSYGGGGGGSERRPSYGGGGGGGSERRPSYGGGGSARGGSNPGYGGGSVHSGRSRASTRGKSAAARSLNVPVSIGGASSREDENFVQDEFSEYRQNQSHVDQNNDQSGHDDDGDDESIESYRSNRSARSNRSTGSARSARSNRSAGSARSARSTKSSRSVRSARSARSAAKSRDSTARLEKNGFEAPLQEFKRPESPPGSQAWRSLAFICTFMVPDMCINRVGQGAKQAWRYVLVRNPHCILKIGY
jgi:hypothetical protein